MNWTFWTTRYGNYKLVFLSAKCQKNTTMNRSGNEQTKKESSGIGNPEIPQYKIPLHLENIDNHPPLFCSVPQQERGRLYHHGCSFSLNSSLLFLPSPLPFSFFFSFFNTNQRTKNLYKSSHSHTQTTKRFSYPHGRYLAPPPQPGLMSHWGF